MESIIGDIEQKQADQKEDDSADEQIEVISKIHQTDLTSDIDAHERRYQQSLVINEMKMVYNIIFGP